MSDEVILGVRDLTKVINGRTLLNKLSFEVRQGEVFGFLGPNGAGKTTTMKIITGLTKATYGDVFIKGYNIRSQFVSAMSHVGAIVENPEPFKYLTGWENLMMSARTYSYTISKNRIESYVELVGLSDRIHEKVRTYSLGMRQRLGLAQAILSSPSLLILDEPTNGMDPRGVRDIRNLVLHLAHEEGMSVFVSTHLLLEAEVICDRIAILDNGNMVACETKNEIASKFTVSEYEVIVDPSQVSMATEVLKSLNVDFRIQNDRIYCTVDRVGVPKIHYALSNNHISLYEFSRVGSSIEDYFISNTKESKI